MAHYEVAVVGGGLVGMISALALADKGFNTVLIAPPAPSNDGRTTALMDHSIAFLDALGVWQDIKPHAATLATMQIIDATNRLLRAPNVTFRAAEIGLAAFGYNIPNISLHSVLQHKLATCPAITLISDMVEGATIGAQASLLQLASGDEISASLVVGADGRNSRIRQAAGINVRRWSYPQTALVANLSHSQPHHNISTEFHTASGPFTLVPLPQNKSSLVWVVRPEDAELLLNLDQKALAETIEQRMQSMLGKIEINDEVQAWPLSGMMAEKFGRDTAILVGEAAHVFPPIGAQGLNLSLRDIIVAVKMMDGSGSLAIGAAFDQARRADIISRVASVDLLNRSLLSAFVPVQMARAAGFQMLASNPPIRQAIMREGIEPGWALNKLLAPKINQQS